MSEPTLSEVLKDMKERLKEAAKTKERLERVIEGLESIYTTNATRRKVDTIETENTTGTPIPRAKQVRPMKLDLRPKIEELLLKGMKAKEIAKATGAKISMVYQITYELRKAGKLK